MVTMWKNGTYDGTNETGRLVLLKASHCKCPFEAYQSKYCQSQYSKWLFTCLT